MNKSELDKFSAEAAYSLSIEGRKETMAKALEWDNSLPKPFNTPEREEEVYAELIELDFIKEIMAEYASTKECAFYNEFFQAKNLRFFYYDDFGRCAVFLGSLEDNCAIRDEHGVWRHASIRECEEFRDENLAMRQITDKHKPS